MTEANKKATKHLRVLTFHRLHRYCWRSAERREFAITSDSHARRKGLKRVFKRYARLNAPGGDLQLRSVATACAMAYGSRKELYALAAAYIYEAVLSNARRSMSASAIFASRWACGWASYSRSRPRSKSNGG